MDWLMSHKTPPMPAVESCSSDLPTESTEDDPRNVDRFSIDLFVVSYYIFGRNILCIYQDRFSGSVSDIALDS